MTDGALKQIGDYYSAKVRDHGATPRGVDWNSEESQVLRFAQLMRVADAHQDQPLGVNEIGCGYGALVDFLLGAGRPLDYEGVDLSVEMVDEAKKRFPAREGVAFHQASRPLRPRAFTVASGIFNVRLDVGDEAWLTQIHATLDIMHETSERGFAFNALTKYSDADKMRDYLYYADPLALFDRCKRLYSRNVALLHDYDLYEFTILVRK